VLQVSLDVLEFARPLRDAVLSPRFHVRSGTSFGPNAVDLESGFSRSLDAQLSDMGWNVHRRDDNDFYFGSVNAALLHDGIATGVADDRRTADAAGD
jgi:gamma-glutamyltranspeptidase